MAGLMGKDWRKIRHNYTQNDKFTKFTQIVLSDDQVDASIDGLILQPRKFEFQK